MPAILDASAPHAAPWVWPLPVLGDRLPVISQSWRSFDDADPHLGVDVMYRAPSVGGRARFEVPDGVAVLAAGAGRVRFADDTGRGHAVIIEHRGGRATYYVHMETLFVARGEPVEPGQPLGVVGYDPTDAHRVRHLHFEIWRHGTRSSAIDPGPSLATWPRLRHTAGDGPRNASWWAVKTPGVIWEEIQITDKDVRALGRDVYATFRRPWEEQYDLARERFKTERGRSPGVGASSDPKTEWALVYSWMNPPPLPEDVRFKTYQGAFVHSWGEFEREWEGFKGGHSKWHQRMWRGSYDQALDYRKRVVQWRQKFEGLGGTPSAPVPHIPKEGGPLGDLSLSSVLWVAGGIAAVAIAGPPLIAALRKDSKAP